MEQREIEFIAEQEWKNHLQWKQDPKNAKIVDFTERLYHDLNQLGYNIQWGFSMQPAVFNGDNRIFPICKKFIEEAENDKELKNYVSMVVWILAHKRMTVATGFLLQHYFKALHSFVDSELLSTYAQTIAKIQDKRYIQEYRVLTRPEVICYTSGYIVEMLGKLKVYEAEKQLIELVDFRSSVELGWSEELFYSIGLNLFISQSAIKALGFLKSKKALPVIEKYLHPEILPGFFPNDKERKYKITEFRNLARKTIDRINR